MCFLCFLAEQFLLVVHVFHLFLSNCKDTKKQVQNKRKQYFLFLFQNGSIFSVHFYFTIQNLFVILQMDSAKCGFKGHILLNRLSITTWETEQSNSIGTAPITGAAFPYLFVVCGEPRVVWRMSAPLCWIITKYIWI